MKKVNHLLTIISPVLAYLIVALYLNSFLQRDYIQNDFGLASSLLIFALIAALAAATVSDINTKYNGLKLNGKTAYYAFYLPCIMSGIITSAFFIEKPAHLIIGLVLLIIIEYFWIRLLRSNSQPTINK